MVNPNIIISETPLKDLIAAYCVIAGVITVFRLAVRGASRWYWDDLCAFIGMLAIVLQTVVLWLRIERFAPLDDSKTASIAFFYLNSICFYIEDWGARCAIMFSIIRITPGKRLNRYLSLVSFGFFVLFLVNVALIVGTCEQDSSWHDRNPPRCTLKQSVPIFRIISGILSDAILVIIPIFNLRHMKSAPGFRRTLMIIFGSSALLTAATIVQAAITIQLPGDPELVASETEGFIALLLCNLSVVVIAIMHLFGVNQFARQDFAGSVELTNGVQVQTLEDTPRGNETRRSSVGSFKKDGDSDISGGNSGFLTRWRKLDVDAGDDGKSGNGNNLA